jgi:hypothetical protein
MCWEVDEGEKWDIRQSGVVLLLGKSLVHVNSIQGDPWMAGAIGARGPP